jgi:diguanylate cyclase (GGDEF)-like protein/PAS domain S-box-containing protein
MTSDPKMAGSDTDARILLVDDDPIARALTRAALEQDGFHVSEAADGETALSILDLERPDLVILDVQMPGMDGFQTCEALRRTPGGDRVPVLILTGLDDVESVSRAYEVGATDFASKSMNTLLLSHRARYLLRGSKNLEALRESQATLDRAQRVAQLGSWEWDLAQNRFVVTEQTLKILGTTAYKFSGTLEAFKQSIHPEDREAWIQSIEGLLAGQNQHSLDHRVVRATGVERMVHEEAEVERDGQGEVVRVIGSIQDVTDRRQAEAQLEYLAYFDPLTGLPNRRLFLDRLSHTLQTAIRYQRLGAVVAIDLDRFKRINDTLGHSVGDQVLQEVGERLVQSIRRSDMIARQSAADEGGVTVARFGGDEFYILLNEIGSAQDAAKVTTRLLETLAPAYLVGDREIVLSASAGITLLPLDGEDVDTLLKHCDAALHHAKDQGRARYHFFSETLNVAAEARLEMEQSLRGAVERGELLLYYQPQLSLATRRIVGAEALIRWQHPQKGLVPPADFIPLAEECGLIVPIGKWVIETACAQAKVWQTRGLPMMRVAVNLSGIQFTDSNIAETIRNALSTTALDPNRFEVELTETIMMRQVQKTIATVAELKRLGIRITMDDFGTGYSSLAYLKHFDFDTLKIDRSFVKDITTDTDSSAIVEAIIAMSHVLEISTLAEGVETPEQCAALRQLGCDEVQGFLFGKPVPADTMTAILLDEQQNTPRVVNL